MSAANVICYSCLLHLKHHTSKINIAQVFIQDHRCRTRTSRKSRKSRVKLNIYFSGQDFDHGRRLTYSICALDTPLPYKVLGKHIRVKSKQILKHSNNTYVHWVDFKLSQCWMHVQSMSFYAFLVHEIFCFVLYSIIWVFHNY